MQTFLFERLSSFSNKRMFIDVCKTFFQYLLLHDKLGMEKYQAFSLFQFVHCCYFVLKLNYHRERYYFVYLSQGCWTMIIFRSFTFKHKSLHICLYTPEIQSKFYHQSSQSKPSKYSAYQKCISGGDWIFL